ncbi:rust resistance kinase Lr10-like [Juglans microcarpa x Juglans regia]|uniref:rust resistance kinase Lr10-like n=1 Tax=Juglans microcarpa x Juglans regia TaxID=2249226 RepID=UPI001B7EC421|nr:rust resistance kinase Lr10-like [Juglans microcarpa x Juglans regia]
MASSFFFFFFFFFFLASIVDVGQSQNGCPELRCGGQGPAVRFPFRLKDRHPDHCGFPGFLLSCTGTNETVLELPISVKLFVKKIDYKSQVVKVQDPNYCFLRQLQGLDLSSSDFQFQERNLQSFALFNCSQTKTEDERRISCLSGPSHQVYAVLNGELITDLVESSSCTKMYSLPSILSDLVFGDDNTRHFKWSIPDCRYCDVEGKNCKLKNTATGTSTRSEIVCVPKHPKGALTKKVITGVILGSFLLALAVFALYRFYSYDKIEREYRVKIEMFLEDYRNFKPTRYSYADIKRITNQLTEKLGEGAYGTVFKGKLSDEIQVAVKILSTSKGNGEEFINEVRTIGTIHHVNVVRLIGFCADGFRRALVYEFLPNGSLEKFISSPDAKNNFLGWAKLQNIALGIARGIEYLHQGCDQRILHFDIKPSNVLLDQNFNPKISDFGLAKLCSKDQSMVSMTTAKGTIGYIAPEVFSRNFGNVSYKADVYSFGILLLEMVGGKKVVDVTKENTGQIYFPEWIYNLLEQKEDLQIFIEDIGGDAKIAKKLAIVGLWCIQWHPIDRPAMKVVIQMLGGGGDELNMPPNPFTFKDPIEINARMPTKYLSQGLEVIPESEVN